MPKYTEHYGAETVDTFSTDNNGDVSVKISHKYTVGPLCLAYWKSLFLEMFMPRGYPGSVSSDYLSYQIWDTVQAFASSINSALATEAILRGAGVGNEAASAMAATVAWLLKDGVGMVTSILFAWLNSPYLDADCKQWRLVADFFNDLAFCLDLIAPIFPHLFTLIVCLSSMMRAVVGVAGGATRTTVTNHQAISDNAGDVAAKDGSQETLVNVSALLCSLILLPAVSGKFVIIWLLFFCFTAIHLYGNYCAVKSLQFRTLNRSLLGIVVRNYTESRKVGTITEVNIREPVLLHWTLSRRHYGCRLSEALTSPKGLSFVCSKFTVICDLRTNCGYVAMAASSCTADQLRAALCLELMLKRKALPTPVELNEFIEELGRAGWLTDKHRLVFDHWTYSEK